MSKFIYRNSVVSDSKYGNVGMSDFIDGHLRVSKCICGNAGVFVTLYMEIYK